MVEVLGYRGKWNELGKELELIVRQNNNLPKEERKNLNKLFEDFAEKHDTTYNSASRYYYNEIKTKIEEESKQPISIDDNISKFANSDLKDPRSIYKIGDTLDVEIVSVRDFGAFAKTKEGFEGLIHISEITGKEYVEMPDDFFYIGEKVKVKLKRFDSEGKVQLSTRALGGKEKVNPAFQDIANAKGIRAEATAPTKPEQLKITKIETKAKEAKPTLSSPNDRDNIIEFIKKYSDNNASQQALADIDEMVSRYGVFQTTISLMEAVRDLDISSFITSITKDKLAGESLRRN